MRKRTAHLCIKIEGVLNCHVPTLITHMFSLSAMVGYLFVDIYIYLSMVYVITLVIIYLLYTMALYTNPFYRNMYVTPKKF